VTKQQTENKTLNVRIIDRPDWVHCCVAISRTKEEGQLCLLRWGSAERKRGAEETDKLTGSNKLTN